MSSIKKQAVSSAKWAFLDQVLTMGASFFISIILARLLTPKDYGIIGMTNVFVAILGIFVSSGLGSSLVRSKVISQKDYSTVFYVNLVVSLFAFALLFVSAPYIALLFDQPLYTPLLRVMGLSLIIQGFSVVQNSIRIRELNFKLQAQISIWGTLSGGALGILLAYAGYGVWSLVVQILVSTFVRTALYWINSEWKPALYFSKRIFKRHWSFGYNIIKSNLVISLVDNVSYFAIAKFYSPESLGQYTRGESFINLFSKNLQQVSNKITFPILCKSNSDQDRTIAAFTKIIEYISFSTALLVFSLIAISDNLIPLMIGDKWIPSIYYMKILSIGAFFYPLKSVNIQLANVFGRSELYSKGVIIQRTLAILFVVLGVFTNLDILVIGLSFVNVASFFTNCYFVRKVGAPAIVEQLRSLVKSAYIPVLISLGVGLLVYLLPFSKIVNLTIQIVVALILYYSVYKLFKPSLFKEIVVIVQTEIRKVTSKLPR